MHEREDTGFGAVLTGSSGSSSAPAPSAAPRFSKASESGVARPYANIHGGRGTISVRYFPFDGAPAPARFVIYDIPPGASEGIHTHVLGDAARGSYDEYYYIIAGRGEMQIEDQVVPVAAGDHVHTPLGVAHGISNTMAEGNLKVFLTFIAR